MPAGLLRPLSPWPPCSCLSQLCKEVGLINIHLFSPADLVDRHDIKRVYLCLSTLSKRAVGLLVRRTAATAPHVHRELCSHRVAL